MERERGRRDMEEDEEGEEEKECPATEPAEGV